MEELIRETDRVYHMASAVGVRLIMEQPVKTIETIFHGTDVVLEILLALSQTRSDPEHVRSLRQRHLGSVSAKTTICSPVRPTSIAGLMPVRKRSTSFSLSRIGRKRGCRSSSSGFSTRSDRARPGNTEWSCRDLSTRR